MGAVQQSGSPGSSHSSLVQSLTQVPVGESGFSKCTTTQVQFRTGQIEALVTMIIVRECPASTSSSATLSFPSDGRHRLYCFKKKKTGEEKLFQCLKKDIHFWDGWIYKVAIPRRNQAVNNMMVWRDGSWWIHQIIH